MKNKMHKIKEYKSIHIPEENKSKFMKFKDHLRDIFFPRHVKCIFCGNELNEHAIYDTCQDCQQNLPFITRSCPRCGVAVSENNDGVCLRCKANNYNFKSASAVLTYQDSVHSLIHRFKYKNAKYLYIPMASYMADKFATLSIMPDIITSVPMHPNKEYARGYNQSKLLATYLANKFGVKYLDLCIKVKDNPSQTSLDIKLRHTNVEDCYMLNKQYRQDIKNKTILLIDDIYTTGATTDEISKILKIGGAKQIYVLTFAHTPPPKDN